MDNNVLAFNQALAAGTLVDASAIGADVGLGWPVGIDKALHAQVMRQAGGRTEHGLWDLLFSARLQAQEAARNNADLTEMTVAAVVGARKGKGLSVQAQMVVGLDEEAKTPCIVLLKPDTADNEENPA